LLWRGQWMLGPSVCAILGHKDPPRLLPMTLCVQRVHSTEIPYKK
jgi:hypothetical protein